MATLGDTTKQQAVVLKPSSSKYRQPTFCFARQPDKIPYPTTTYPSLGFASPIFKIASGSCDYYSLRIPLVKAGFRRIPHPLLSFPCNVIWGKSQPKSGLQQLHRTADLTNSVESPVPGELGSLIPLLRHPTQLVSTKQKFNHFPGSHAYLGCKRGMYLTIDSLKNACLAGKTSSDAPPSLSTTADFDFVPATFLYPDQKEIIRSLLSSSASSGKRYIWKPARGSCGRGIVICNGGPEKEHEWKRIIRMIEEQVLPPTGDTVDSGSNNSTSDVPAALRRLFQQYVVQEYIEDPMLINGRKLDLRLYVAVTSFDPLVVYLHRDGLVRFAAHAYDEGSLFGQLTNYSIGRRLETKAEVGEDGSEIRPATLLDLKWNLPQFQQHIDEKPATLDGASFDQLMQRAKNVIVKTLLAAKPRITRVMDRIGAYQGNFFELFGFDIMFDRSGKAWLIEVNTLPSLESSSTMDYQAKSNVVTDLLNMALVEPFDRTPEMFRDSGLAFADDGLSLPHADCKFAPYVPLKDLRNNRALAFAQESNVAASENLTQQQLDAVQLEDLQGRLADEQQYSGRFDRIFPIVAEGNAAVSTPSDKLFMDEMNRVGASAGFSQLDIAAGKFAVPKKV